MQIFKCDGEDCKHENNSLECSDWLTIGSTDGANLFLKNQLPGNVFNTMSNYSDLHFCSQQCFVSKFFAPRIDVIQAC